MRCLVCYDHQYEKTTEMLQANIQEETAIRRTQVSKLIGIENETNTGRTIAIGGISEHTDALNRFLDEIAPSINDKTIPPGDVVEC